MKKLLAMIVAAAFASTAFAQSKDVTDKKGGTVTDKKGGAVTTKDVKEKPQHPAPKFPKGEARKKEPKTPGNVSTKRGEGSEVKSGQK
jgi:hypothetical protein